MSRKSITLILIGVGILVIGISFALGQTPIRSAPLQQNTFPPFTIVYQRGMYGFGDNGKFGTARIEVVYEDPYHWKTTLLESDTQPERVGAQTSYDGTELKSYDPRMGVEQSDNVFDEEPTQEDEPVQESSKNENIPSDKQNVENNEEDKSSPAYAPDQWLDPLYISRLLANPNTTEKDSDIEGTKALVVTEHLPCRDLTDTEQEAGLKECEKERVVTKEVIYRTDYFIPLKIVTSLDGVPMDTITVEKLEIK